MAHKILLAKDTRLLDEAYRLRHQVFVEEEGLLQPSQDLRIVDRFDAYPSTHNLVVTAGEQVIGCFRLALDSSQGVPADDYYDFRSALPPDSRIIHSSFLCVTRSQRTPRLAMGLGLMAAYFADAHSVTHVVAPINPRLAKWLMRTGYQPVGDAFTEPRTGARMVPLVLDMGRLRDTFLAFIRRNQLQDFQQDYERWFYDPGEQVIRAGDPGTEAFLIIDGEAEVRVEGGSRVVGRLGTGDVFGELALITDEPRSADVFAVTHLQVMVLSKAAFLDRFLRHPEQALAMMRLLGRRIQGLLQQMEAGARG